MKGYMMGKTNPAMRILGREPAVFFALVSSVLLALVQILSVPDQVAVPLNAVILAAAGLATALLVQEDRVLPALLGAIQAVFALYLGLGSPVPDNVQAGILSLAAVVVSFFVRDRVVATVSQYGESLEDIASAAFENGYARGQDGMIDAMNKRSPTGLDDTTVISAVPAEKHTRRSGDHSDGDDFSGSLG